MITDETLPEGWSLTKLGVIATPSSTRAEPSQLRGVPYLSLEHIESNTTRIIGGGKSADVKSTKSVFHAGDVLYGKLRPYLNKVCIPMFDGICSTDILVFPKSPYIESKFVMWFLTQGDVVSFANHHSSGVQLPRVSFEKLAELEFPLPPLAEQRRIVAKVKAVLAEVNVARERLANVAVFLKRFRQSVLAAACSSGESVRLGEILESVTYGTGRKCLPDVSGTPVLRIPNIAKGLIDKDDLKFAKLDRQEREKLALSEGDILMIRSNGSVSLVGRTALVSEADTGFAFAGYLLRLRFDRQRGLPSYVSLALRTYEVRGQIEIPARSTSGVHNINAEEVRKLRIRLPSLKEQSDVVRRVETLFAVADSVEKQVAGASGRADRLFQSILGKAFRGELVPTEAELARQEQRDYEPASALLERIRAAHADED
jgi:type I restriction enzyme S subunit